MPQSKTIKQANNSNAKKSQDNLIAYFCMEFALDGDLEIYSGGLGVLAGDFLYEANTKNSNIIGVGLLYSLTYKQQISENGKQIEQDIFINPEESDLSLIVNKEKQAIRVSVLIQEKKVLVQAWEKKIGQVSLILLDTQIPENTSEDQNITNQLYVGDREHRLKQEIILGIGGVKMLKKLAMSPDYYHMNEGHSALLSLEVGYQHQKKYGETSFKQCLLAVSKKIIYTNHTLVTASRDVFSIDLISVYLANYAQKLGVSVDELAHLGQIQDSSLFSMSMLALRTAGKSSAVSKLHSQKAKSIWTDHPLVAITNGIHFPRWISVNKKQLILKPSEDISLLRQGWWQAHQKDKEKLISFVKQKTQKEIAPETLIFSWARRFVTYKRPTALFWNLDWLESIIKNAPFPVHFLFSGKIHPHNEEGKELIAQVVKISQDERFKKFLTFIPDYCLEVAKYLVRGSDVWLNTPIEGYEACGTSGMKAALNGVLQCSTNDGWMHEVNWKNAAWILDNNHISESLYNTIEHQIIPLFNKREGSIPEDWVSQMITSSNVIKQNYSAGRMLKEYCEHLYI